ncbi:MAG: monovalent cation/H(+) antiporter subunit G [Intestinimonas sp.]|jgi:multicomponent Na+:H+ antiporter subunit G|nr:monovalent cation/H(+) antiporter subunit G [Intestinimonas sp.]
MISTIFTVLGLVFILAGVFVFFTSVLGIFRLHYVLNRLHAAAVGDTLGIFCILIGTILMRGWSVISFKTLLILVFMWLVSPVASHLLAEMEYLTHPDIGKKCEVERR